MAEEIKPDVADASSPWWIPFWIAFAISWLLGFRLFSLVTWCAILITLRKTDNDISRQAWIAFWLSARNTWIVLFTVVGKELYILIFIIVALVRFFAIGPDSDGNFYELPPTVFWVLVVSLLPTLIAVGSNGSLVFLSLVLYNTHFAKDGIHLPAVFISGWLLIFLAAATLVFLNYLVHPQYVLTVLVFFVVVAIMHEQMWPYNEDFGLLWIFAWFLLYHAIIYAYAPFMHPVWYIMWTGIITGLGFAFRPDHSVFQFMLWAVIIWVLRPVAYVFYMFYFKGSDEIRANLFPFSYFSHKWRLSRKPWLPISMRPCDDLTSSQLCVKCDAFTSKSKLIMGSKSLYVHLEEWHNDFWTRAEFVSMFAEPETGRPRGNQPGPECPLRSLLWYSMSTERQKSIIESVCITQNFDGTVQNDDSKLPVPQNSDAGFGAKVWEERPLSYYTYLQLFWGDIPIGARLLVHRDLVPATPSPATTSHRTNSPAHFEQARKWLQTCRDSHTHCHGAGNSAPVRPARMLYVSGGTGWLAGHAPETLKLVKAKEIDFNENEYLALSHCWGPTTEMRFKLLASNIDACYESIDFFGLSQNMQDAITTTLALGFSYIWIDSLCIIQKDHTGKEDEAIASDWKEDWNTEAPKMGSVYSAATCTIASTGSATSSGGCFHDRDPSALTLCKIGVSSVSELNPTGWIYARRDDVYAFERGISLAPLNTRGWVMQERLLSRRILHFGADMLFWECGGRSASELNPQGYIYKRYPDDFSDNYSPDIGKYISTRGDVEQADREGRGFRWASKESERLRPPPPPVMIDPDRPVDGKEAWQRKRGFWKNVLKSADEPWSDDEKNIKQDDGNDGKTRIRAGFRAAFEQLRRGSADTPVGDHMTLIRPVQVGQTSFSQSWYDIVEMYSRGQLTSPKDKLMAMKGIQDEVARVTKFTYLYGLWRERLITDLLWFAIDGPGRRLLQDGEDHTSPPVAPTWSWASIEGAVALDLLPENSLAKIELEQTFVTIQAAYDELRDPAQARIYMTGPLLQIDAPSIVNSNWQIYINDKEKPAAQFFPDVEATEQAFRGAELYCLPFLGINRDRSHALIRSWSQDVQGLVLRRVNKSDNDELLFYERLGYFTTSYTAKSRVTIQAHKTLKSAPIQKVCLVGWSGLSPSVQP